MIITYVKLKQLKIVFWNILLKQVMLELNNKLILVI